MPTADGGVGRGEPSKGLGTTIAAREGVETDDLNKEGAKNGLSHLC